jgi:hypothetical protein
METTNLDIYGHPPIPWSRAEQQLEAAVGQFDAHFFLATVRPDGRPHVAGIGALWVDGRFYFVSRALDDDRRANAPASRRALRRAGLAGDRQGRRVHRALQRTERRATTVGPLRIHAKYRVRRGGG